MKLMLARYYGFGEDPFGATPDPRYLYQSKTHREALASLFYAFYCNRGFTTLIAPPGMGKTTLLFQLLQRVSNQARTAFLFNSQCTPEDLLRNILTEIGQVPQDGLGNMLQQLNRELVETARTARHFLVVVDEAQNLSEPALEALRLLTNFETSRAKLMQIVLSGQPQLNEILQRPGLVQLRQRVSTFCRLEPFAREETEAYIAHRLSVAGYQGPALFGADALSGIAKASEGIPRNINTLCFNALSLCCALKKKTVNRAILEEVLDDLQLPPLEPVAHREEPPAIQARPEAPAIQTRPEVPAVRIPAEAAIARKRGNWLGRMRIPALAAGFLISVCGAFWVGDVFSAGHRTAQPQVLSPQPAPDAGAGQPADVIEITVSSKQTLSEISILNLGTFNDEILRQIRLLNPGLENPNRIAPGQKILLPSRYRLQRQK